jgi:hypothetical protein
VVRSKLASQSEAKTARLIAARRLKNKESMGTQKEKSFGLKDVSGYAWVLIPSVLAIMQIFRLANGSNNVALALASSIDIRTLVMGIFVQYTPSFGLLAILLSLTHIRRFLARIDRYGQITVIAVLLFLVLWCVAYDTIFVGILTVLVGSFIAIRIAKGKPIAPQWGASTLILAAIMQILLVATSTDQLLPAEALKINTGQQMVGYVINPNQGGWATVLPVAQNGTIYRFESSAIVSRIVCEKRLSKWQSFLRSGTLSIVIAPRRVPHCPAIGLSLTQPSGGRPVAPNRTLRPSD